MSQEDYNSLLRDFVKAAVAFERTHGYPAEMLCAQFALESGWGAHPTGRFNYFGMTYNPRRHSDFTRCATHEELTERGIAALPEDERSSITEKVPLPNGKLRVALTRKFASYASLDEAIRDKTSLIMQAARYRKAWEAFRADMHYETLMKGVETAGYATGSGYAAALERIIHTNTRGVRDLIELARAGKLNGIAV